MPPETPEKDGQYCLSRRNVRQGFQWSYLWESNPDERLTKALGFRYIKVAYECQEDGLMDHCIQRCNRTFTRPSKPLLVRLLIAAYPKYEFPMKRDLSNPRLGPTKGPRSNLSYSSTLGRKCYFHRTTPDDRFNVLRGWPCHSPLGSQYGADFSPFSRRASAL